MNNPDRRRVKAVFSQSRIRTSMPTTRYAIDSVESIGMFRLRRVSIEAVTHSYQNFVAISTILLAWMCSGVIKSKAPRYAIVSED